MEVYPLMPAHRLLPPRDELKKMLDKGMSHQDIADHVAAKTGHRVKRSSVSAAVARAGLGKTYPRYSEEIPWRVQQGHDNLYPARMLRLLGRRRAGLPLEERDEHRLDSWMAKLRNHGKHGAVVAYLPDTEQGFWYVDARPGIDDLDVPVRKD